MAAAVVILAASVWWIILPQDSSALQTLGSLELLSVYLLVLAVSLELASFVAYSALTASVLGAGRPSYFTLLRIDSSDVAVSHVVPGAGRRPRQFGTACCKRAGVPPEKALSAAAIQNSGSNLVLATLFTAGLLLSLTTISANVYYRTASIVALVALVATGVGIWFLTRHTTRIIQGARVIARRIPLVAEDWIETLLGTMAEQILPLVKRPRRIGLDFILAAANWLLDVAALLVLLAAFGHFLGIGPLLTVYGVACILAMLPLTPCGLGIVEGSWFLHLSASAHRQE